MILEALGLRVGALPMSRRTPFADVLLIARLTDTGTPRAVDRFAVC
ncbi:MAG: hypothetical protein ABI533_00395 [Betaproteobacteria bacterium]